ncbi:MAG: M23 family metallopeptidase, partial [Leptospiraceae bacterium]|nr:M23 family metallopeptidase [Leptospiraceae bacterium]
RIGQILRINSTKTTTSHMAGGTIYKMKVFALPVLTGRVTSRFGYRRDPFNPSVRNYHSGLDLSAPVGTPVIASAEGVVEFKGRNGGYGNTVIIRHKGGYKTIYAHCSTTVVEVGDFVKMGKVIGSVGRTGTATGAHLHFEVIYKGKLIDPEKALRKIEIVTTKPGTTLANKS